MRSKTCRLCGAPANKDLCPKCFKEQRPKRAKAQLHQPAYAGNHHGRNR
jgi:hypothetical protein